MSEPMTCKRCGGPLTPPPAAQAIKELERRLRPMLNDAQPTWNGRNAREIFDIARDAIALAKQQQAELDQYAKLLLDLLQAKGDQRAGYERRENGHVVDSRYISAIDDACNRFLECNAALTQQTQGESRE